VPDWSPFRLCPLDGAPDRARGLNGPDGLGDRLRTAAFAELQATAAFRWAVENVADAAPDLKAAWARFAEEEAKHYGWLLARMEDLGVEPGARAVSDALWRSLTAAKGAREFCESMARAEDRGREAERAFEKLLAERDPKTAEIFARIAAEEDEHIARQRAAL
jgi:uncharacterized ferritin-like protein (DUF455 family)